MIVGWKDSLKLVGVVIVSGTAVFVSTIFLNFYLDVSGLRDAVPAELLTLYEAQLAMAKFVAAISGGCLGVVGAVMLLFYIRLYISSHIGQLGVLKALGWSERAVSLRFGIFGFCVFLGAAIGFGGAFGAIPAVYRGMAIEGMEAVTVHFHAVLFFSLVLLPSVFFSVLACLYARAALRRSAWEMLRGKGERIVKMKKEDEKERSFLREMSLQTLKCKKLLAFFMAFAAFCFSAMIQMSLSMRDMTGTTMWGMIFVIGLVLSVTVFVMAVTTIIRGNNKSIAMMKAFGYTRAECARGVFGGYRPCAWIGFAVGTAYQYGLLQLMTRIIFKGVGEISDYTFDFPVFLIVLAVFTCLYECAMFFYSFALQKVNVKEIMQET